MGLAALWALIVVGLFFVLVGSIVSSFLIIIGFALIGLAFYLGFGPNGILTKDQVIDSWSFLLEKANGKAEEIFGKSDFHIKENKAPAIMMERRQIAPGVVRGLLGTTRDFLVVTDHEHLRLKPYKIFLNARDYGENLDVSWYLTFQPTSLQALLSLIPLVRVFPRSVGDIDLFDQQDLRAYSTVVHHSVLQSVEALMLAMNQDPSKIERKSRGFLGIS